MPNMKFGRPRGKSLSWHVTSPTTTSRSSCLGTSITKIKVACNFLLSKWYVLILYSIWNWRTWFKLTYTTQVAIYDEKIDQLMSDIDSGASAKISVWSYTIQVPHPEEANKNLANEKKKIISKSIRKHVKTNDKDNRMVWNIIYVIHMYIVDLHFFTIFHHIFPRSFIFTMFRFWCHCGCLRVKLCTFWISGEDLRRVFNFSKFKFCFHLWFRLSRDIQVL